MSSATATSADASAPILLAHDAARLALLEVGPDRVELVTVSGGWVSIHPAELSDGVSIARVLGLDVPLDHRMVDPGYTMWSGVRDGFEFQVRSALRRPGTPL